VGSLLISLLKFSTKNLASRDYNDADGKTMAIEKLTQQANTLGCRSSENLLIKALIYFKAFEWRNSLLSIAESTFVCLLCDETLPIGRCMFFIKNFTDTNAPPNACPHALCSGCHRNMSQMAPYDENIGVRAVVSFNRTHCLWCRQDGRFVV